MHGALAAWIREHGHEEVGTAARGTSSARRPGTAPADLRTEIQSALR